MFTGIIEEIGTVKSLEKTSSVYRLQVSAAKIASGIKPGQSISVNGACLTVVNRDNDSLYFDIMQETIKQTTLGLLKSRDKVNLERALRADGVFDGHFVSGHIDETGAIMKKQTKAADTIIEIEAPEQILRYIILKGSVALDGISLTVSAQGANSFCVNLIPYTLENTTLGFKKQGDKVNIECDILAKYTDRLLTQGRQVSTSKVTLPFLKEQGFA